MPYIDKELEFDYTYANESFSGCDMVATLLVPITKDKKKAYVIGEIQTLSYSTHMDRRAVRAIGNINAKEYLMGQRTIGGSLVMAVFDRHFSQKIMKDIQEENDIKYAFLADELPPFDIVITAASEYGMRSKLVLYNVRLVNEGQVMSVNDVYTENTYQFVALDLEYLNNENEYINNSSKGKRGSRYVIKEDGMSIQEYNPINVPEDIPDKLICKTDIRLHTISTATKRTKGEVELFTAPKRLYGNIIVTSSNKSEKYTLPLNNNNDGHVRLALEAGKYSAQWINGSDSSSKIDFEMIKELEGVCIGSQAPMLEAMTDSRIDITVNSRDNTRAVCIDEKGREFIIELSGKEATIHDLEPDTTYRIYSCNEDMTNKSPELKVTTFSFGYNMYSDFRDYLIYNKKVLYVNNDFNLYMKVLNDSEQILYELASSRKLIRYKTISDTIQVAYKRYKDELDNLSTKDYTNIVDYNNAISYMKKLIKISRELIAISSSLTTDKVYGYNYDTKVVDSPVLQYKNGCTNTFFVSADTHRVEFYKKFGNTIQYDKTINRRDFISIDNNFACVYTGRPNTNCYCVAYNDNNFVSSRTDFYVQDNEYRASELEDTIENKKNSELEIERMRLNVMNSYENLNQQDLKRVCVEAIKDVSFLKLAPPVVIYRDSTKIVLSIHDDIKRLNSIGAVVVASTTDEALMNYTRYKVKANDVVIFSISDTGMRPDTNYIFWIEDSNSNQISLTTGGKTNIETSNSCISEYNIDKYFIDKYTKKIIIEMQKNNCYNDKISEIIYRNANSYNSTKTNIMQGIINDILESISQMDKPMSVLNSFYTVYFNIIYSINQNFFNKSLLCNKEYITVPMECNAIIYKLGNSEVEVLFRNICKNEKINTKEIGSRYALISFSDKYINSSGYILIDTLTNKKIANNIKIEGEI